MEQYIIVSLKAAFSFESVHGATIFTKLDLRNAYHLVCIHEGDECKMSFKSPIGHGWPICFSYLKEEQENSRQPSSGNIYKKSTVWLAWQHICVTLTLCLVDS
ncbi:hypothetical protein XENOCAPTIV_020470, partial [Xenoophorus captivus]